MYTLRKSASILLSPLLVFALLFISDTALFDPENIDRLECYMILAGKQTTVDGSVLLAHNNDLKGYEASLLEKFPAQRHSPGEVVQFPSGLEIPQAPETYEWMVLRIYRGYAEGDAVAVNEHNVAIAGGVALGGDRNQFAKQADPLVKTGLTGGVRYVALSRSKTARECVELVGSLYTKYGVTYPSGFGVADTEEIWYIESGGGRSWAAVRVPDDAVWVQANGYRIGEIDPNDTDNFLCSPNLLKFAEESGLWNPAKGKFHFARAFGQKVRPDERQYYNTRRVWRGITFLIPASGFEADRKEFPMFTYPEEKIDIPALSGILRDHYRDTEYDFHKPDGSNTNERPIAVRSSIHTTIVQLRENMPTDIGAVLWGGVGPVVSAMYVPYYFGITEIPKPFNTAGKDYSVDSAFWLFRTLGDKILEDYHGLFPGYNELRAAYEEEAFEYQRGFEKKALNLYNDDPEKVKKLLTDYVMECSEKTLKIASEYLNRIKNSGR